MSHIERKIREKEELKHKILTAAREIAAVEGWHNVTIRKIADKIEYTAPIVYEHFESKEDLIRELIYMGFRKQHEEFEKCRAMESDPQKLLLDLAVIHWEFAEANKEMFQLMFSLEKPAPNEEMIAQMKAIKQLFLDLGHGDEKLADELILGFFCLSHGAVTVLLQFAPPEKAKKINKKEAYIKMIKRYINSAELQL